MVRHDIIKTLLLDYKQCVLSDKYHKQGEQLVASIAINKKVLWSGLNLAKRLGYSYK